MTERYARLSVGDEVLIESNSTRAGDEAAHVIKVGRTLYHVLADRYAGRPDFAETFRIDTRHSNNEHSLRRIATPAEVVLRRKRGEAIDRLREIGLTFRSGYGNDWSTWALSALADAAEDLVKHESAQSSPA